MKSLSTYYCVHTAQSHIWLWYGHRSFTRDFSIFFKMRFEVDFFVLSHWYNLSSNVVEKVFGFIGEKYCGKFELGTTINIIIISIMVLVVTTVYRKANQGAVSFSQVGILTQTQTIWVSVWVRFVKKYPNDYKSIRND